MNLLSVPPMPQAPDFGELLVYVGLGTGLGLAVILLITMIIGPPKGE